MTFAILASSSTPKLPLLPAKLAFEDDDGGGIGQLNVEK
jgi:hypothetical protein